jgi:hypothetical protein
MYSHTHAQTHNNTHEAYFNIEELPFHTQVPKHKLSNFHLWCFHILIYSHDIYTVSANIAQIVCKVETSDIQKRYHFN